MLKRSKIDQLFGNVFDSERNLYFFFILVLGFLSIFLAKLHTPLYWGHDTAVHYARLDSLITAIKDGRFPMYVNYTGIEEYGYFIKAFYSDFLLIPFGLIGLFTGTLVAYEAFLFTITIFCGILTYWSVNRIYKNNYAAFIAAILYTFCTYRLLDLYQRGALGEVVSFTFLPIVLVGAYELIKGDYKKWYILTIGYSLLIFNHVLSTVLTTIVLIIFMLIYAKALIKEPKRIAYFVLAAVATIFIVSYYLFPMLEQMASNVFYYNKYPSVSQLFVFAVRPSETVIGLLNSITPPHQEFAIRVGSLLAIGAATRIFVNSKTQYLKSIDIICIVGVFLLFATTQFFPWKYFPFNKLYYIQFPWRFIEYVSFFLAIAGGYYIALLLKTNMQKMLMIVLITGCTMFIIASENKNFMTYAMNEVKAGIPIEDIPDDEKCSYGNNEYIPAKVTPHWLFLKQRGYRIISQNDDTRVSNYHREKSITKFDLQVNKADSLELPMFYYKGYYAEVNKKSVPISESSTGMVSIPATESGEVEVYYKGTTIQTISCWITIISILLMNMYIFRSYTNRREKKYVE